MPLAPKRYWQATTAASRTVMSAGPRISISQQCPDIVAPMLAWMDLEMTGLDPSQHVIVEIATLITDDALNLIAEGPDLVVHATNDELAAMDDFVTNMHTKSGLLDQIKASTISLEEAGKQTLAFLQEHIPDARTVPLCGNSIGTDRRFLAIYLPEIEEFLHYRSVDVSTIKELARRWYPEALANVPRKDGGHRALDDIRESLKELRYWRGAVFADAPDANTEATH
ncbi:MAG: oligoribonuclease [Paracrocinitomix sp.]|jgi:oligoribonuclease